MKYFIIFLSCLSIQAKDILFIGNSYTANTRPHLQKIAQLENWNVTFITPGGRKLLQHFASKDIHQKIQSRQWDYIFLQEQSQTPAYSNLRVNYYKALEQFHNKYPKQNFVLFTTWGRRDGDKMNKHIAPDYLSMQILLDSAFDKAATKFQFQKTATSKMWRKIFMQYPDLFNSFYAKDGSHLSPKGGHFNALWIYEVISKRDSISCSYQGPLSTNELNKILLKK